MLLEGRTQDTGWIWHVAARCAELDVLTLGQLLRAKDVLLVRKLVSYSLKFINA
jgi:hypothetical protein